MMLQEVRGVALRKLGHFNLLKNRRCFVAIIEHPGLKFLNVFWHILTLWAATTSLEAFRMHLPSIWSLKPHDVHHMWPHFSIQRVHTDSGVALPFGGGGITRGGENTRGKTKQTEQDGVKILHTQAHARCPSTASAAQIMVPSCQGQPLGSPTFVTFSRVVSKEQI